MNTLELQSILFKEKGLREWADSMALMKLNYQVLQTEGGITHCICGEYPELSFYSYSNRGVISTPQGEIYIDGPELTISQHLSCPLEPNLREEYEEPDQEEPSLFFYPSDNMGWSISYRSGVCIRADGLQVSTNAYVVDEGWYISY